VLWVAERGKKTNPKKAREKREERKEKEISALSSNFVSNPFFFWLCDA
jgi:hypothetical protein